MESFVDVAEPFHDFGGQFFRNAADPRSPLSPFSPESAPAREASTELIRRAVEGSDLKVAPALRAELPELLWLLHMGVVLFWVYDDSPGQRRTRTLVAGVVPIVDRAVRLTRLPLVSGLVRRRPRPGQVTAVLGEEGEGVDAEPGSSLFASTGAGTGSTTIRLRRAAQVSVGAINASTAS